MSENLHNQGLVTAEAWASKFLSRLVALDTILSRLMKE